MNSKKIKSESLDGLLLVQHLLNDPITKLRPRAIDADWGYQTSAGIPTIGFNPLKGVIYYPVKSQFQKWIKNPRSSARNNNYKDRLVKELWGAVHDYMHIWALNALLEIIPKTNYGVAPITMKNFEDFVFIHNVTEVAASVGTDYWFICNLDLNEECGIGSAIANEGFQTTYHERDLSEFQKFNPHLVVQDRKFFTYFADVYIRGYIRGFDEKAILRSPKVDRWLTHEILYGEVGRVATRKWFIHLSDGRVTFPSEKLTEAMKIDKPWKKNLIDSMGELLWEKTKQDKIHKFKKSFNFENSWSTKSSRTPNFRFINLNKVSKHDLNPNRFPSLEFEEFNLFFQQLVSCHSFEKFDKELLKLFDVVRGKRDMNLALSLFRNQPRVKECHGEPYDLFLIG